MIAIIWLWGAVWVKLQWLLDKHLIFKNSLSKTNSSLSKLEWLKWSKEIESILENNEVVVLAVNDDVAKQIVDIKTKVWLTTKIIDCSTDHRTNPLWTYGLPELKWQKDKIETAELVANPWCHATAVILSVKPLMDVNFVDNKSGIITSSTWYSWWGKKMIETFENGKNQQSFQYSTWVEHKHEAEIKNETWLTDFIFQPEVVNYFNWLKVNVFLNLTSKWQKLSEEDFIELFNNYYNEVKNIKISSIPNDWEILMSENNETQNVSIYIKKYSTKIQIVTVIDNMMKWAAWAVIQNLNIMMWFDEGMGLG